MNLDKIHVYRMIHIENIPHILENGITHKNSKNSNPDFKPIGDISLINTRAIKRVKITNGGNNVLSEIVLGDYIPFYFAIKTPMLYVIQNGGNFVKEATTPENIIYMACSVQQIDKSGFVFYFSDGHATDVFSIFYNKEKVSKISSLIDWNAITSKYWGGSENLDTKRKKQAEFLFAQDLPTEFIKGYVCYNQNAKDLLISYGVHEKHIKIVPKAYY
jgi:hypothetical protein